MIALGFDVEAAIERGADAQDEIMETARHARVYWGLDLPSCMPSHAVEAVDQYAEAVSLI